MDRCGGEGPPCQGVTPHGHYMCLLYRCMNFCCHASMILLPAGGQGPLLLPCERHDMC